jgi:hypothetical protein
MEGGWQTGVLSVFGRPKGGRMDPTVGAVGLTQLPLLCISGLKRPNRQEQYLQLRISLHVVLLEY